MGRQWNPAAVKDFVLFDSGPYTFEITSLAEGQTNRGQFAYKAVLTCVEGAADFVGSLKAETFTMGTDEDPTWDDPETVGPGARSLKQLFKACGLDSDNETDIDALVEAVQGVRVGGIVTKALDKGGTMRDNISRWFPAAEEKKTTERVASKAAPAPARAVARPAQATASAVARAVAPKAVTIKLIKCSICNEMVPRDEFGEHMETAKDHQE